MLTMGDNGPLNDDVGVNVDVGDHEDTFPAPVAPFSHFCGPRTDRSADSATSPFLVGVTGTDNGPISGLWRMLRADSRAKVVLACCAIS